MAAYLGAINAERKFSSEVKCGALILCKDTGEPADVLEMSEKDMEHYWKHWLDRVQKFWKRVNASRNPASVVSFVEENNDQEDSWPEGVINSSSHNRVVGNMFV